MRERAEPSSVEATPRTIACDESGSEGDRLLGALDPVFVHGSTSVSISVAEEFMRVLREGTRSPAREIKSAIALRPPNRKPLMAALETLENAGNICLVEKTYFVTARLFETLLDPDEAALLSGVARHWTDRLHARAPAAVGEDRWLLVLSTFNALMRVYARAGTQRPTTFSFYTALESAVTHCRDDEVGGMLRAMFDARGRVELFLDQPQPLREFDPMWTTLPAVAKTWTLRLGDVPLRFLADNYGNVDDVSIDRLRVAAAYPTPILGRSHPGAVVEAIKFVDSASDARIQVADILAGVGRAVARQAYEGTYDDELQVAVHEMLDINLMTSSGSPVDVLVERAPLEYLNRWIGAGEQPRVR